MILTEDNSSKASDPFEKYREEINAYYLVLKNLTSMDPVEVFQHLSAFSARASELKTRLHRVDSNKANAFRTREVEPLIDEIDRQFKFHSRLLTYREIEMKISGERGMT